MAFTVAICHSRVRFTLVPAVPLFLPRIAVVVVTERFPESGLVTLDQAKPADPLRALPEIKMRYDKPRGTAVLGRERLAVVLIGNESLSVDDVGQREIRGVAAVRERDDESRPAVELHVLEEHVRGDAAPARVELRPLGHAADVLHELLRRELSELVPGPLRRLLHQTLDAERPGAYVGARRRARGEDRKVLDEVLARRDAICGCGCILPLADETSGDTALRHGACS